MCLVRYISIIYFCALHHSTYSLANSAQPLIFAGRSLYLSYVGGMEVKWTANSNNGILTVSPAGKA